MNNPHTITKHLLGEFLNSIVFKRDDYILITKQEFIDFIYEFSRERDRVIRPKQGLTRQISVVIRSNARK